MSDTETLQKLLGPRVALRGQVRYTGEIARKGYRLTAFITSLTNPANRERFRSDPEAYMADHQLTAEEARLIRERDCMGMFHYGVNIYAVAKAGTVLGVPLQNIGAQMRGLTPEGMQAWLAQRNQERKDLA